MSDAKPEPDVLERAAAHFKRSVFGGEGPIPRELCCESERVLLDAIAELECERAEHAECCETLAKMDEQLVRAAKRLRAITDAEPVRWEKRKLAHSDLEYAWVDAGKGEVEASLDGYEFRALAVVAPKGERNNE